MANGSKYLKSENKALRHLKVLENTLKTITNTIKKCDEYEKQIKEHEEEKKKYEKEKEEYEKEKEECKKEKIELEKQIKTNEDSMQQLRTGFEQQKRRADIYQKNLTNVVASYKGQQQKLQQAEKKIKELEQSVPIQLQKCVQRCVQLGFKRIAVQPLPGPQPQKIPNISQKNPSGQYVNWNLDHEHRIVENCYYSSKLMELSVIEAINKGCIVDTNISMMYRVNRFNRFPGNGEYLDISLKKLADAKCRELTNFNGAVNVMSQTTLKALVDFLCNKINTFSVAVNRSYFENGNSLTWNDSL